MQKPGLSRKEGILSPPPRKKILSKAWKDRWLYFLLLPGLIYFIIYKYIPIGGLIIAFKNYRIAKGIIGSEFVGLKHFKTFFLDYQFAMLFRNTFMLAIYNIVLFFPLPIVLALLLNEVHNERWKRIVQSTTYLPHFLSWVVIYGITYTLLNTQYGVINLILQSLGQKRINFLLDAKYFRLIFIIQLIWRDLGWASILFLAALAGVDLQLYESAILDGANRFQRLWHITLPAIRSTIITMLILRLGRFMEVGFEHVFLLINSTNRQIGEIFDTYVYTIGVTQGQYSYATAVGMFKGLIGLVLVFCANKLARYWGEDGVY